MSDSQIRYAKWALVVLWLFAGASFFMPAGSSMRSFGQLVFWLMLVAHALECTLFWRSLQRTGRPIAGEIIQTVLFGIVHYQDVRKVAGGGRA